MRILRGCRPSFLPTVCFLQMAILGSIPSGALMGQALPQAGTFTDSRDGSLYRWIRIESQVWMAENLRLVTETGSWCYEDEAENCKEFGRLYDWPTAMSACPPGWRLPSSEEWDLLKANLSPEAGTKMKKGGTSGFDGLMAGYRFYDGSFHRLGRTTDFWTTDPHRDDHSFLRNLRPESTELETDAFGNQGAVSVRCVRTGGTGKPRRPETPVF